MKTDASDLTEAVTLIAWSDGFPRWRNYQAHSHVGLAELAWSAVRLAAGSDAAGAHIRSYASVFALDACHAKGIHADLVEAEPKKTTAELEREMERRVPELLVACRMDSEPPQDEAEAQRRVDGVLWLDEALASYIETFGACGAAAARNARKQSRARAHADTWDVWIEWLGPIDEGFLFRLAIVLWEDVVGPRLQRRREERARNPAALVLPVMVEATLMHSRGFTEEKGDDGRQFLRFDWGHEIEIRRADPLPLPTCEASVVDILLRKGIGLLGSVAAHRVLRWEVRTGYAQMLAGDPDFRAIRVEGGWSGITHLLGMNPKRDGEEIHAIIAAQAHCCFNLPTGAPGNLLSYTPTPARGQRKAWVTIVLGDALLPGYVHTVEETRGKTSKAAREARRLVPIIDLPPFVGRPRDHGQQATFSLAIVTELRIRARELAEEGSVHLPLSGRMVELAEQAKLPRTGDSSLTAVLARWTRDDKDGPAFMKRSAPDRYTLNADYSESHAAALKYLLESGNDERRGSEAGKRSVASRGAKLERVSRDTKK